MADQRRANGITADQRDDIRSHLLVGQFRNRSIQLLGGEAFTIQSQFQILQAGTGQILRTGADDLQGCDLVHVGSDVLGECIQVVLRTLVILAVATGMGD